MLKQYMFVIFIDFNPHFISIKFYQITRHSFIAVVACNENGMKEIPFIKCLQNVHDKHDKSSGCSGCIR